MRFTYLLVLAACLVATLPLELWLHARVYARLVRLLLTVVPVAAVFCGWDVLAIRAGHWHYHHLVGVMLPGRLPLEELLFFVVIPVCAILTFEAVRRLRPAWRAGDEQ